MWGRGIRYDLLEQLGEGSQGRVFKASRQDRASGLSQIVAAKILHSKTAVDLWRREFESLARVRSPYCLQVLAFERLKGRPALILEYVDGVSLFQLAHAGILDTVEDSQELLAQIECGLRDLHAFGVFHGDLSPHNVLVDTRGTIRLLDFGLANCVGRSARLTPEFAAPERLAGEPASFAADFFSLGRLEQFLRGQPARPDAESPYLCAAPESRAFRGLTSSPQAQSRLALKVAELTARRARISETRTRTQARGPITELRPRTRLAALLAMTVLLGLPGASQSTDLRAFSPLHLRTERWHYFHLDGSPIGYSPLSVPLVAGRTYLLEWQSTRGHGKKYVRVGPSAEMTLSDSDFSH